MSRLTPRQRCAAELLVTTFLLLIGFGLGWICGNVRADAKHTAAQNVYQNLYLDTLDELSTKRADTAVWRDRFLRLADDCDDYVNTNLGQPGEDSAPPSPPKPLPPTASGPTTEPRRAAHLFN